MNEMTSSKPQTNVTSEEATKRNASDIGADSLSYPCSSSVADEDDEEGSAQTLSQAEERLATCVSSPQLRTQWLGRRSVRGKTFYPWHTVTAAVLSGRHREENILPPHMPLP